MESVGTIKPKILKWLEFSLLLEYEFEVIKFNGNNCEKNKSGEVYEFEIVAFGPIFARPIFSG